MTDRQIRLAVFDVDGTLLRGDTACLWIARRLGRYDRMLELEQSRGRPDVSAARDEMASWYRESTPDALLADLDEFPWAPGLFEGIRMLRGAGVKIALSSVGWEFVVKRIAKVLGAQWTLATKLDFSTGDIGHAWGVHPFDRVRFKKVLNSPLFHAHVIRIAQVVEPHHVMSPFNKQGGNPRANKSGATCYKNPQLNSDLSCAPLPGTC